MDTKHLIMGTAGHVDHGKTTLIKALTGYDCDTHKQEKERGITINLGFSHLDLPNGNSVGIVDVPGHADFIKTMVAGACGIDFVLLVIAADEGIMPQTKEHLDIMKTLVIKSGKIVLTKIDLVDEELLELATEEIMDFVKDSFLNDAPVTHVSSHTKQGVKELINEISTLTDKIPQRKTEGLFRMYIDRIFTQEGFGTIVNGSIISGTISKNEPVFLLPNEKELRIRRLEHHGIEVNQVSAGDRASFNLVGFKQKDFKHGMVLSNKKIKSTKLIDIKLNIYQNDVTLGLWNQVIFLLGTNRIMARIHLLDRDHLKSGESCLAQVYLPQPIITQYNDKFIIRNSSGNLTLGGGYVVDPYPLHHRRRKGTQVEIVKKIAGGELEEMVAAEVRKSALPISQKTIAEYLDLDPDDLIEVIFQKLPGDIIFYQSKNETILLQKKMNTAYQNKILTGLKEFHQKNPLKKNGRTFKELMGIFGEDQNEVTKITLTQILQNLEEKAKLRKDGNSWILASHEVKLSNEIKVMISKFDKLINSKCNNAVDPAELSDLAADKKISKKQMEQIISYLVGKGNIHFLQQKYLHSDLVEKAKKIILEQLTKTTEGIKVSQLRDLLNTNRNTAMILLEFFDSENITLRKGDFRFLTKKFKEGLKK
ncbi:MAG: selenocysteine-specific translation elongation factor [Candidatus Cloacimonetes bacterium]|jgi:selenocysteine-specific elongation factor|nr:selenocysteine-specific translation elongation factor [Candidatus Cloacimonadota bacterium]